MDYYSFIKTCSIGSIIPVCAIIAQKMNFDDDAMPKLQKNFFNRAVSFAYTAYYGHPFPHSNSHKTKLAASNRLHHGILHALACADNILNIHAFYQTHVSDYQETITNIAAAFKLSENDLMTLIQTTALFHDAGRQADGVDRWDEESAEILYDYLIKQDVDRELASLLKRMISCKDDPVRFNEESKKIQTLGHLNAEYLRQLMNTVDTLEVIRVRREFRCQFLPIYSVPNHLLKQSKTLKKDVRWLVECAVNKIRAEARDACKEHRVVQSDATVFEVGPRDICQGLTAHDRIFESLCKKRHIALNATDVLDDLDSNASEQGEADDNKLV